MSLKFPWYLFQAVEVLFDLCAADRKARTNGKKISSNFLLDRPVICGRNNLNQMLESFFYCFRGIWEGTGGRGPGPEGSRDWEKGRWDFRGGRVGQCDQIQILVEPIFPSFPGNLFFGSESFWASFWKFFPKNLSLKKNLWSAKFSSKMSKFQSRFLHISRNCVTCCQIVHPNGLVSSLGSINLNEYFASDCRTFVYDTEILIFG